MAQELPLALPRNVTLKNKYNNKYLRYTHELATDEQKQQQQRNLQFTGEEAVSPYTKFVVEQSKTTEGLVHIRCCYNNQYWARTSETEEWLGAAVDSPQEDQSDWSCTLFQPVFVDNDHTTTTTATTGTENLLVRFLHVQLNNYACLDPAQFLQARGLQADTMSDVFEVLNWETLLVLPPQVAFKGDNERYLRPVRIGNEDVLQFSGTNIRDRWAGYQVFTNRDGGVRIRSNGNTRFFKRGGNNWILANAAEDDNNADTMFWPLKVADRDVVALRNYGNALFCRRDTSEGRTNCLRASGASITTVAARIKVEEVVGSRSINGVVFRLQDGRIYDQSIRVFSRSTITNAGPNAVTVPLTMRYTNYRICTWDSNVSVKLGGVPTTIRSSIPVIGGGGIIEVSGGEMSGEYTWGEPSSEYTEEELQYQVAVPPHSRVDVTLSAAEATCDVPFSYSQSDTLFDGTTVRYKLDDGVYTVKNTFNVTFETKEEKLV